MMRRVVLGVVGAGLVAMVSGCGSTLYHGRHRTTVVVQTPRGVVSGSAVRELSLGRSVAWAVPLPGEDRPQWDERGEAVAVDLPGGQTLFVLLGGAVDDGMTAEDGDETQHGKWELWPRATISHWTGKPYPMPLLVRFKDIRDPASVEKVDPANLSASFGPGVALKAITVEKTRDPVTSGIERRLGWLVDPKVMASAGWSKLPYEARSAINGLFSGTLETPK